MSAKKPEGQKFQRLNVTLPADVIARLRAWGRGNLSAGIRQAVAKARKREG